MKTKKKQTKKKKPTLKSIIKKRLGQTDWDPNWYRHIKKNWRIMADLETPRKKLRRWRY